MRQVVYLTSPPPIAYIAPSITLHKGLTTFHFFNQEGQFMRPRKEIFALLIFIATFVLSHCGCTSGGTGGGDGGRTPDEPYTFNVSSSERIKSEYTQYLLARFERRPIWIGGDLTGVAPPVPYLVWWTNAYNQYPQGVDARDILSNNKYFQTLSIDDYGIPFTTQSVTFNLSIGVNDSTGYHSSSDYTTTVNLIDGRVFNYEYHYQNSYDMTTDSPQWRQTARTAFVDANTSFHEDPQTYTAIAESVEVVVDPQEGDPTLESYATANASYDWQHNVNNKKLKYGLIYSVWNIKERYHNRTPSHQWDGVAGISTSDPLVPFFTYVLLGRIRVNFPNPGTGRENEVNRVITHEMGHQRGLIGHTGNPPQPDGHNGRNQSVCVMHDPLENGYTPHSPPVFCEGHIQRLMNQHWYQEEIP